MLKDRWRHIRDTIERDIRDGVLQPGDRLPNEAELGAIFGAGRHSIRRAISELAKEGRLSVEQGRGTFVEATPNVTYTIGARTRLHSNLLPQGYDISGALLDTETIPATKQVAEALRLATDTPVIKTTRLNYADGLPISFGSLYHEAQRFTEFSERRKVLGSVTATYKSYGIDDYLRGETAMHCRRAREDEAKLLKQHPDQPVIVIRAIDTDMEGRPISFSKVIWSGTRVKFNVATGSVTGPYRDA
ncbi:MAG: phosphonate metabolism transcriptional regulator PhnF [Pseudomonadota bacterium]